MSVIISKYRGQRVKKTCYFVLFCFVLNLGKKHTVLIIALCIAAKTRNKLTDPQIVDRQNVGSAYQGVLFNHPKQGDFDICNEIHLWTLKALS